MLRHNLKVSLRSFQKSKSSFIINLIGLSAGLLCTLLIFFWVKHELSVDKFHADNDRIFRAMEHQFYANGDVFTTWSTPGILAAELKAQIPEIEYASTSSWNVQHMIKKGESNLFYQGLWVDQDFFSIFDFKILQGNPRKILSDINSIVITESIAKSLFGNESAIDKTLILDNNESFKISGVVKDPPTNSTIEFDYVLNAEKWRKENDWLRDWGSNGPGTFVKTTAGSDPDLINEKIKSFIKERNEGSVADLFIYPFADTYLHGRFENTVQTGGRIEYVRLFSIIAAFVLIIACINFMNLSTAKASKKAKEVGIRKALGAYRNSLIKQYLFESFLITAIAIGIAIAILPLILPFFNEIIGLELSLDYSFELVLTLVIVWFITGLLSGSYPALYLSHFQPIRVLKNDIKTSWGELWARRGLVVFQFVMSIFLIISVSIVYSQIQYVLKKDLGYNRDNLVYFWLEGRLARENKEPFLNELEKLPDVLGTSLSANTFTGRSSNISGMDWPGKMDDEVVLFEYFRGNEDLISNMGIKIVDGRDFSGDFSTDDSLAIIFNKKAIKLMRLEDPVGKTVQLFETNMKIIGVTEDFHFTSFHTEVPPAFFIVSDEVWLVQARLSPDNLDQTLKDMDRIHSDFNPGFIFDYKFQDESYRELYASERRVATISQYFAGFAILISCLGLFGLAAFTAERRLKEIGIRKVLGASVTSLMLLLSNEFTKLVLIAIFIAIPISWWASKTWLEDFAYHVDLSIIYFAGAGIISLVIALITVSSQAYSAATINPIDTLKDE